MAEQFIAEVRIASFNFPPKGWAQCDGQLLPINQNQALFAIVGTTYGGDGRVNFALPDLRGRTPIHTGQGLILGNRGGEENHTIIPSEMPAHIHVASANSGTGNNPLPTGHTWGNVAVKPYTDQTSSVSTMSPTAMTAYGGSQPHNNMQPYLVLNFIIALTGTFPSQS